MCRYKLYDECNFGILRDIIIPPFAVSVPRIDMSKKAILGIQNSKPKARSNSIEWPSGELKLDSSSDPPSNAQASQQATTPTSSTANQNYSPGLSANNNNSSTISSNNTIVASNSNASSSSNLNNSFNLGSLNNSNGLNSSNGSSPLLSNQISTSPPSPQLLITTIPPTNSSPSSSPLPTSSSSNNSNSNATSNAASIGFGSGSGSSKKKDKAKPQLGDDEDSKELIKVYDGNASYKNRVFRTISVSKNCSYQTLLVSSRKKKQIFFLIT